MPAGKGKGKGKGKKPASSYGAVLTEIDGFELKAVTKDTKTGVVTEHYRPNNLWGMIRLVTAEVVYPNDSAFPQFHKHETKYEKVLVEKEGYVKTSTSRDTKTGVVTQQFRGPGVAGYIGSFFGLGTKTVKYPGAHQFPHLQNYEQDPTPILK